MAVHPLFFRRGIGKELIEFIFENIDSNHFTVETAIKNIPAITLYKKLGFHEVKQWDTEIGIRKIQFIK
ncbi:GNAT family N-acetyltransferase [Arenibacter latericius]|uniref:GNAT family N-acetyltransferase n=1 Tax=Arenibacter latericius TaxID=86104 RepID=UPI0004036820|nr:GNAT family N-acetyltransferase [Arenibacter latericius]